jgi:hypothetical protein
MNMLELLLRLAGLTQFAILSASALTPHVLDWRTNLAPLHPFLRRLFWTYGAFIVLVIVSFGTLTLLDARAMAAGEPVARSLAAFIGVFWLARLLVQLFVFDCRVFLTTPLLKVGYHTLTLAFISLALIYGWAALLPAYSPLL